MVQYLQYHLPEMLQKVSKWMHQMKMEPEFFEFVGTFSIVSGILGIDAMLLHCTLFVFERRFQQQSGGGLQIILCFENMIIAI